MKTIPNIIEICFFFLPKKFQGAKEYQTEPFLAGVSSTIALFVKMYVRDGNILHLSRKLQLGLTFPLSGGEANVTTYVIESIRMLQAF